MATQRIVGRLTRTCSCPGRLRGAAARDILFDLGTRLRRTPPAAKVQGVRLLNRVRRLHVQRFQ